MFINLRVNIVLLIPDEGIVICRVLFNCVVVNWGVIIVELVDNKVNYTVDNVLKGVYE